MKRTRLMVVVLLVVLSAVMPAAREPSWSSGGVLVVELGGDIPEWSEGSPWMGLMGPDKPLMLDKLMCLGQAARDDRIKGVVVRITDASYSFGKAQELRDAIKRFRADSGKPIVAYLELEGGGNVEYYLAAACDKVYLSPASTLNLTGLATKRYYLGGLWEKIYVEMQVDQIKEYKSAADMIARTGMSDAEREVTNSILDSMYGQFTRAIAEGRGVPVETVTGWVDAAWLVTDKYVEAGTVDGTRYLDELADEVAGGSGTALVSESDYFSPASDKARRLGSELNVAVVYGVGNIVTGEDGGMLGAAEMMSSDGMIRRLRKVMQDDDVDAVIFRVDSGGGSALASDLIWRAAQGVKDRKPIVVSMADVAGSGGYYIACGASSIVAQPGTITGSIGILTAHPSVGQLLKKFGVGYEVVGRGEFADLGRMDRPMNDAELARTHAGVASLYDLFITRVGQGRGMSKERVNELGRGRIYTGEQAQEIGLVDRLGGFETAMDEVRRLTGSDPDRKINLIYQREKVSLWKLITGRVEETMLNRFLSPDERDLIRGLRLQGLYHPGQPLALMPGSMEAQ